MILEYIIYLLLAIIIVFVYHKRSRIVIELDRKTKEINADIVQIDFENTTMKHLKMLYSEIETYYTNQKNQTIQFSTFQEIMKNTPLPDHTSDFFIETCLTQIERLEAVFQNEIPRLKSENMNKLRIANIKELLS